MSTKSKPADHILDEFLAARGVKVEFDDARRLLALIKAEALEQAAEEITIPVGAFSLAAAWLQGRATKLRNSVAS